MTLKLGINGFGRIGRSILRALCETPRDDLQVVAINDPAPLATLAHLFAFDSFHGRFPGEVKVSDGALELGIGRIAVSHETDPAALAWQDVDIALECSGRFLHGKQAQRHFDGGADRVLLSAPAKDYLPTVVYGVNHTRLTAADTIVSNASCTTNCLAPVAQVLHQAFGIERGMMTTVHSYTSTQPTQDAPHADLYRARAAGLSMIPTSTGAAQTLGDVLPELAGRITGQAIRVPCPNVSCVDLSVDVGQPVTVEEVNAAFEAAAASGPLRGVLSTEARKLVSMDFAHHPDGAIVAVDQTRVQSERLVRVLAWYDNEWGFAHRMIDTAAHMGRLLHGESATEF
jgi:glyceraldehyde 3-phosphate dehydrogenase